VILRKENTFTDRHVAQAIVADPLCWASFFHHRLIPIRNQFLAVTVTEPLQMVLNELILIGTSLEMHYRPAYVKIRPLANNRLTHKANVESLQETSDIN